VDGVPLDWLLDSDPALRWQVERDLVGAPPATWEATRAAIPTTGFGAALLARQDPDGQWDAGAYFPGGFDPSAPGAEPGQPWTATTWTLTTLREWGMDPGPLRDRRTAQLLDEHARWEYDGLPYWDGEVDCCINAMTLANGLWLGVAEARTERLADWFLEHQLADGGWNCEWVEGSIRSSVHSTLNAVKGLLDHERATGGRPELRTARRRGEEFLLERGLIRRLSTGELLGDWVVEQATPFRWRHTALHALTHLRAAGLHDGTAPDARAAEAVETVLRRRRADGTWVQDAPLPGKVWFATDVNEGEPSRWLTLHATRVLDWWDRTGPAGPS